MAAGAGLLPATAAATTATSDAAGRPAASVRVVTWNIYKGGHGIGAGNLPHALDQLVELRPDIYLAVETYGSGEAIREALSRGAGHGRYTGVQITDRPAGKDNLWIFTHLPVAHVYPKPAGGTHITDFNLGGIRVRLADGQQLNAFVTWINYTDPWVGYLIDENAAGVRAGLTPPAHRRAGRGRRPAPDRAAQGDRRPASARHARGQHRSPCDRRRPQHRARRGLERHLGGGPTISARVTRSPRRRSSPTPGSSTPSAPRTPTRARWRAGPGRRCRPSGSSPRSAST
ncbi:hypothetical protein ACFQGX_31890 [Nonomuraea dietziae]|uniref:hypothetical protein n=1 Tax=Nonomuraea dietziae TaxID=65515 RepID=UPI00360C80D1